ncbi:TSUP family transporter [Edwardsiella tarda]|uniref:TSUP family transporter n=1 Tax=Edwardsiella tarda TaxID=636 RepID=UPI00351C68CC
MQSVTHRNGKGFFSGTVIGAVGGLIGLGGAEFRLPVLVSTFKIPTLEAVVFNKAMSLTVVAVALIFRTKSIAIDQLLAHIDIVINLLAGSLIGAWWAAGRAIKMSRVWLDKIILVLLLILSLIMFSEAWLPLHDISGGSLLRVFQQLLLVLSLVFSLGLSQHYLGSLGESCLSLSS